MEGEKEGGLYRKAENLSLLKEKIIKDNSVARSVSRGESNVEDGTRRDGRDKRTRVYTHTVRGSFAALCAAWRTFQLKRANKQREWLELSTTPAAAVREKESKKDGGQKGEARVGGERATGARGKRRRRRRRRKTVPEPGQREKTDE